MISKEDWKWFGHAAHLIVGQDCRFHLATEVGTFLISTVGEYLPDSQVRETLAISRGIKLTGRGDARQSDYMEKIGYEEVGYGRKYETMVFAIESYCIKNDCNCGIPIPLNWSELDPRGYNSAKDATVGHRKICLKYAKKP
jgi:hypothetical protein